MAVGTTDQRAIRAGATAVNETRSDLWEMDTRKDGNKLVVHKRKRGEVVIGLLA